MTSRKATTDDIDYRIKDTSLRGLLVAFGITGAIAIAVIVLAFASSHGILFQSIIQSVPALEGLDKQIQESYSTIMINVGELQQWVMTAFDMLSSIFS